MINPLEVVYIVIFNLYKIFSSKSRTLESLWYRLDNDVFKPELIRVEKHSILGLFGMTRIDNKTNMEREYLFNYLSYHSVIDKDNLYDFKTMLSYLKDKGVSKSIHTGTDTILINTLLETNKKLPYKFKFIPETKEIVLGKDIGVLRMNIVYDVMNDRLSILGIPSDILLMLDGSTDHFKRAVETYIKHYHSVSYRLITNNKII